MNDAPVAANDSYATDEDTALTVAAAILLAFLLACLTVAASAAPAWAQGTVKIAYIDPLSGGAASAGILGQKHFNYFVDKINAAGGVNGQKLEVVAYEDLGTEAIRRLEVEGFPAIVVNDCHGGDLYQDGMKQYARE